MQQDFHKRYKVKMEDLAELLSMPDAVNTYIARGFIRPGLASWGSDIIYISPDVCFQMAYTMKGKPMTLEHPEGLITAKNRDEKMIGAVTEVERNDDGGYDAHFFIDPKTPDGEEAIDAVSWHGEEPPRIKHVSCVYQVIKWGDGGTLNGVKYDREVLEGQMLQLALTENPRYDGTWVIQNSDDSKDCIIFTNETGGLDLQVKNCNNNTDEEKEVKMKLFTKKSVDVDQDVFVETDSGSKTIKELVQIANSAEEMKAEIASLKSENESLKAQIANEDDKKDEKDEVKNEDEEDKKDSSDDKKDEVKNECDDEVKNEDDKSDEDKEDEEDGEVENCNQPKNSIKDLDAETERLNAQIFNSDDTKVEFTMADGMAHAAADFANK